MSTIALEDIKYRIFVDTNILIDCFVTPETEVITFVSTASKNDLFELVTSDYALWEQNEFIRKHTWIKHLVNSSRSHKEALTNRLTLSAPIRQNVETNIVAANSSREAMNIFNYNLMDSATPNGDFFTWLELLTINSTISSQDLLILLSAYVTKSKGILTKDGAFDSSVLEVAGLEVTLGKSLLPASLKQIKFINNFSKSPQQYYNEWFVNAIDPLKIGECVSYYSRPNVVGIDCQAAHEISVGDYILLAKPIGATGFKKVVFKIDSSNLQDYDSAEKVAKAKKVTVKLPDELNAEKWMDGAKIFRIADV